MFGKRNWRTNQCFLICCKILVLKDEFVFFFFIEKNKITNNIDLIDKYKVIITYAMSGGNKPNADGKYQILSSLMVLNPNEVCTETFLVIKVSNNIDEANNIKQYLATKFSRYLLLQSLSSIHFS